MGSTLAARSQTVSFTTSYFGAVETSGVAVVTLERFGATGTVFTVDLLLSNGTATAGADFIAPPGTITFSAGELTKDVIVPILDDPWVEGRETLSLRLAQPSGGAVIGAQPVARVALVDNESPTGLDISFDTGTGPDNDVFALALQPDGKILVGGQFTNLNGAVRGRIARLHPDGALDTNFTFGSGANGDVYALAVASNGMVFLGGAFTSVNGVGAPYLAGVRTNGTTLFLSMPPNNELRALAIQPDGKFVIGGRFTSVGGGARGRIARLQADLTLDAGFDPGAGANDHVRTLALQPDGRVLIGGLFSSVNGVPRSRIARLQTNGVVDATFNPGTGANGQVRALAVQADGGVLIGGEFTQVNGVDRPYLARLNPDGSLDPNFNALVPDRVRAITVQGDGRILIGGNFSSVEGLFPPGVARLHADGSLDRSFDPGDALAVETFALAVQPDGRVLAGGQFWKRVARFHGDAFAPGFRLAYPSYPLAEDGGPLEVEVLRTGASSGSARVEFSTEDLTALAGSDYVATNGTLTFGPLETVRSVRLSLINDGVREPPELFRLALRPPAAGAFLTRPAATTLYLEDNDFGIEFGATEFFSHDLGGSFAQFTVIRRDDGGLATVEYSTSDGTAQAGLDYVATNGVIAFGAGETNRTFAVRILPDTLTEGTETVNLQLRNVVGGSTLSGTSNAVLNIVDVDSTIRFDNINEALEGREVVWGYISRYGLRQAAATVYLTVTGGTATEHADFVLTNNLIRFEPGEFSVPFFVTILNDALAEPIETIQFSLSDPTGGAVLGEPTNAVLQLRDNDHGLEFSASTWFVNERGGGVALEVRRQDDGEFPLTVNYDTVDGTAKAGSDYPAMTGSLTFAAGETNKMIFLPVNRDGVVEADEFFDMALSDPSVPGTLGATRVATVRLLDCERPGSVDPAHPTASMGPGAFGASAVLLRADGKVVLGGWTHARRLNADGSLDTNFVETFLEMDRAQVAAEQSSGKVLMGGAACLPSPFGLLALARLNEDGGLDESFQRTIHCGPVLALAVTTNDFILAGGAGLGDGQSSGGNLIRLDPDGVRDTNFTPLVVTNRNGDWPTRARVNALALQPDGRVLAGGVFHAAGGEARPGVARVDSSGALDPAFAAEPGLILVSGEIHTLVLQPDGKVLVPGGFVLGRDIGGVQSYWTNLARFHANGTLDTSFRPDLRLDGAVRCLLRQPSGKWLIGGDFTTISGFSRPHLARVNADWTLDPFFDPGTGPSGPVYQLDALPNGDVLGSGGFSLYNGAPAPGLARIKAGDAEYAFLHVLPEFAIVSEGDGPVVVTVERSGVTSGTVSLSYEIGIGTAQSGVDFIASPGTLVFAPGETQKLISITLLMNCVAEPDRALVVVFGSPAGAPAVLYRTSVNIEILDDDRPGSLDTGFAAVTDQNAQVKAIALEADGSVLIAGDFGLVNDVPQFGLARLTPNGVLDEAFRPIIAGYSTVYAVQVQPDGRIVMGGEFRMSTGYPRNYVARLHAHGTLDAGFNASVAEQGNTSQTVFALALQPDGRVLIGGVFRSIQGMNRSSVARLHGADGALDLGFNPGLGAQDGAGNPGSVLALALQPDGRVLVGGWFIRINSQPRTNLARLNPDGSVDLTFNPGGGLGPDSSVDALVLLPGGKVLVGGRFTRIGGVPAFGLARLNENGAVEVGFTALPYEYPWVSSMVRQADGRLLIAGTFGAQGDGEYSTLARLQPDFSVDPAFRSASISSLFGGGVVYALAVLPGGDVLAGGAFNLVSNRRAGAITRLRGDPPLKLLSVERRAGGDVQMTHSSLTGRAYVIDGALDGNQWATRVTNVAAGGAVSWTHAGTGTQQLFRVRELAPGTE